jgi:hypothetical protein
MLKTQDILVTLPLPCSGEFSTLERYLAEVFLELSELYPDSKFWETPFDLSGEVASPSWYIKSDILDRERVWRDWGFFPND